MQTTHNQTEPSTTKSAATDGVKLHYLTPQTLQKAWVEIEPWLIRACDETLGEWSVKTVVNGFLAGKLMIWVLYDHDAQKCVGAGATANLQNEGGAKRIEVVVFAAAEMHRWLDTLSEIERYGKECGCSSIRVVGRKGWAKKLSDYKLSRIVLEKALT
jgi:hypothetical protein